MGLIVNGSSPFSPTIKLITESSSMVEQKYKNGYLIKPLTAIFKAFQAGYRGSTPLANLVSIV
jgi:hypothetical protein